MWRPWSKKNIRLAIAPNGVAVRDANGKVHQITCPEHLDLTQDMKALNTLLESQRALLAAQKVEVVLAHSFVRFLVLPWQQVMRAQDWQAIARHAFKKTFGNAAADWQIDVQLSGYKKPVVAAAIDQATFSGLQNLANAYGFQLLHINPLANFCVPKLSSNQGWLMIAEPQRLMLIQRESDTWQNSWVDAPPAGAEQQHAEQLVQRIFVQLPPQQRPVRVTTFVSAELQSDWQKKSATVLHVANPMHQTAPHAAWMGGLSMQTPQFDFSPSHRWVFSWVDMMLCALALLLAGVFYWVYQAQAAQLTSLQAQQLSAQPRKIHQQNDTQFSSYLNTAAQTQHALNVPWLETLSQLEQVKLRHPQVQFLSVEPNSSRAQIYLKIKAKNFAAITQFLEALKTVTLVGNAELSNQFAEDEDFSVYEVKVDWKI